MQLKPKLPPGRSDRKALRYGYEVRRLRAEGHSLASIREALLDVGVSVSLSTVRREAIRPTTKWELDHAEEMSLALEELPPNAAAPDTTPWSQQHGGDTDRSVDPAGAETRHAAMGTVCDRYSFGLFTRILAALRSLRRFQQTP